MPASHLPWHCLVLTALTLGLLLVLWVYSRRLRKSRIEQSHIQALVDSIPDLTWVKDRQSRFLMVNRQFSRVFDLPIESILGKTDEDINAPELAKRYMEDDRLVMNTREVLHREEQVASTDGTEVWAETVKVPVIGANNEVVGTAGIARDISERKRNEKQISHLAHHDALTGLPNRVLLELRFKHVLSQHQPDSDQLIVMFIDLDNFKVINDTVNHTVGDMVLMELANRLRRVTRKDDIVARIGGDEFVIVLPKTELSTVDQWVSRIQEALRAPINVEEMLFETHMSIGIARYPLDGTQWRELIENADLAMYHAKQTGKNKSAVFAQFLAERSLQKMTIDARIEDALARGEFVVNYQPKVAIQNGRIVGLEALLRWQEKESGKVLLPEEFIPSAERSGFIVRLGDWMIEQVLQQMKIWQDEDIRMPVSVNLAASQIHQKHINGRIKDRLQTYGICGSLFEIELTENVVMDNIDQVATYLQGLADIGVKISIDDFGTGYSKLADLSRLPLKSLKIDRIFIQNIDQHKEHRQIALAIVEMAKSLELNVVAEGVETLEELRALQNLGVDQVQGFLFDLALAPDALASRLDREWSYESAAAQPPLMV